MVFLMPPKLAVNSCNEPGFDSRHLPQWCAAALKNARSPFAWGNGALRLEWNRSDVFYAGRQSSEGFIFVPVCLSALV